MSTQPVILCPGQGAQAVGMGRAWFEKSPAARQMLERADAVLSSKLGAKLTDLCFNGPDERLNRTDIAQPAIFAVSVASFRALFPDAAPSDFAAMAGLSLGEYTALHLAGAISFESSLELVFLRGQAMQSAAEASKGSMVALIGADDAQAQAVCDKASQGQVLVPANYNAPGQIVLSGHAEACDRAVTVAGEMGFRATKLAVAGAFHSPLMQPAADRLAAALAKSDIQSPHCRVISNVTAQTYGTGADAGRALPDVIRQRLVEQLTKPVRWSQSCAALAAECKGEFHELAPNKVLAGLMRRIDRAIKVVNHDEPN